jgi:hypothetical protein
MFARHSRIRTARGAGLSSKAGWQTRSTSSDKLLWLSSRADPFQLTRLEQSEDRSSDPLLEAAQGLGPALAAGALAGDVGPGRLVLPALAQRDRVERPVEPPVATAVEAHPPDLTRRRRDGCHPGEHGEGCRRTKAGDVARLGDQACHAPMRPRPVRSLRGLGHLSKDQPSPVGTLVSGPTRPRSRAPSHAEEGRRQLRTLDQEIEGSNPSSPANTGMCWDGPVFARAAWSKCRSCSLSASTTRTLRSSSARSTR